MLKKHELQATALALVMTFLAGGVTVMADDGDTSYPTISAGQTIEVTAGGEVDESVEEIYTFTPEETGIYYLYSDCDQGYAYVEKVVKDDNDKITYKGKEYIYNDPVVDVYLEDPEDDNDDSEFGADDNYYGYNFFLIMKFEKGVTYYLKFKNYAETPMKYEVTLASAFDIVFAGETDPVDFILVDPGQEFTLYEESNKDVVPDDNGIILESEFYTADAAGLHFKEGVEDNTWIRYSLLYSELNQSYNDLLKTLGFEPAIKYYDIFVMGEAVDGTLESGQTVHIDNDFVGISMMEKEAYPVSLEEDSICQLIYSFTPENDGKVKISITNVEDGLPAAALFESDYSLIDKIIGYDSEEFLEYTIELLVEAPYGARVNDDEPVVEAAEEELGVEASEDAMVMEASLEGGKVYYVAIPLSTPGLSLHSEFDVTLEYEEQDKEEEKNNEDKEENKDTNNENNNDKEGNKDTGNENNNDDGGSDKEVKDPEAFVKRLYEEVLGREADPDGLKYWVDRINDGATGADVVKEFLKSSEFNGNDLNDEDFVIKLYSIFFGRIPGKDEIKFWVDSLKDISRDTVINNFINTTEWDDFCKSYGVKSGARFPINDPSDILDFARRLYTCCLEREPDSEGLKFWNDALVNHKMTGPQVAKEFFWSAEFLSFKTSDEEFITRLYRTMLGREPEPEGFAFWINDLKVESREEVFMGFARSPEFKGVCEKCGISWM